MERGTLVLTGGGTAGHVMPNLALLPALKAAGWRAVYVGAHRGIEQSLATEAGLEFHGIATGKLRRYFSWQNFIDPFRVLKGIGDAYQILGRVRPQLVFSKGGFVSVPVVLAAWLWRIPVILHESDLTPGLANRLSVPWARRICTTFPETVPLLPRAKTYCTGLPIRMELRSGSAEKGRQWGNFSPNLPVLVVIGGSSGSETINRAVRQILPVLTQSFQVLHVCGKGNVQTVEDPNYCAVEFLAAELPDVLAMADLVVSRAGANAIFELLALRKPHLLIPLSTKASRGDQIQNAISFAKRGYSMVLQEENLTPVTLAEAIARLYRERHNYIEAMNDQVLGDSIGQILVQIEQVLS
ncbi:MAG: undecaprenyldiphospho-muramoylpentapeptide beta-N-acetylglucosaminyltransferase [Oscillatoriales cyanobacterium SM2_2_1]|nr:undecaprenyldiphospho-muramoylpentapeptide beta-N-acetylglucosaminyltransferase [Oscillatoriales cyanobacterium SM2_2_1]